MHFSNFFFSRSKNSVHLSELFSAVSALPCPATLPCPARSVRSGPAHDAACFYHYVSSMSIEESSTLTALRLLLQQQQQSAPSQRPAPARGDGRPGSTCPRRPAEPPARGDGSQHRPGAMTPPPAQGDGCPYVPSSSVPPPLLLPLRAARRQGRSLERAQERTCTHTT